jgi:Tol biopolymer transport system component
MILRPAPLLLAALAAVGCRPPDGSVYGTDELVMEPTLFAPGIVSTDRATEYAITFSPDGREAYFTRSMGGRRGRPEILVTRVADGAWSEPEPVPFATGWEETPYLAPDGRRLLFSSRRDVPGWGPVPSNGNLWMVERGPDGVWSAPVPLSGEVNKPRVDDARSTPGRNETGAVLDPDGTLLYSTQEEPERAEDIYVADQVDGRFVNVRPMLLNTSGAESSPALSPDGRWLVFHGFRDVFATGDDLFASERTEYGWSPPRPLPEPINSPDDEGWARFSPDGRLLFFSSDRGRGGMSIYYVAVEAAGINPPSSDP